MTLKPLLVTTTTSTAGVVDPSMSLALSFMLGHRTLSTAAELVAIREAVRYLLYPHSSMDHF